MYSALSKRADNRLSFSRAVLFISTGSDITAEDSFRKPDKLMFRDQLAIWKLDSFGPVHPPFLFWVVQL